MTASTETRAWSVYLLRCADGTLYCGSTSDLGRRLRQHNGLLSGGARYTRSRRPVALAARRDFASRAEAQRMEARVKRLPAGAKIRALAAGTPESSADSGR